MAHFSRSKVGMEIPGYGHEHKDIVDAVRSAFANSQVDECLLSAILRTLQGMEELSRSTARSSERIAILLSLEEHGVSDGMHDWMTQCERGVKLSGRYDAEVYAGLSTRASGILVRATRNEEVKHIGDLTPTRLEELVGCGEKTKTEILEWVASKATQAE